MALKRGEGITEKTVDAQWVDGRLRKVDRGQSTVITPRESFVEFPTFQIPSIMNTHRPFSFLLVFVLFGVGCTSLFSGEEASVEDVSEIAGTYTIQNFEFVPQASALDPINLLDHVEEERSTLELTESQDFILTYRTEEGSEVKVTGPYGLTEDHVEIQGQEKDEARFKRILLDRTFSLNRRTSNSLWFENQTEITPEALSSWYEGMNQVEGTLRLEFAREGEGTLGYN